MSDGHPLINDEYPDIDYTVTIRCDVCHADFKTPRSTLTRKFLRGAYCSETCARHLRRSISDAYLTNNTP